MSRAQRLSLWAGGAVLALALGFWVGSAAAQMTPAEMAAQALAQAERAAALGAEAAAAQHAAEEAQTRVSTLEEALRSAQASAEEARERLVELSQRGFEAEDRLYRRKAEHAAAFGAMISLAKAPAPALAAYGDRPAQAARAASALSGLAEALEKDARQMRDSLVEYETLRRETQAARAEALTRIEEVRKEDAALKTALRDGRGRSAAAAEEAERLRKESEALSLRAAQLQAAMAVAPPPSLNPRRPATPEPVFAPAPPPPQPAGFAATPPRPPVAPPVPARADPDVFIPSRSASAFSGPPVDVAYAPPPRATARSIYDAQQQPIVSRSARAPVMGARLMSKYGDILANGNQSYGLHYEAEAGSIVYSPFNGVVDFAGPVKTLDNVVIINVDGDHKIVLAGLGDLDAKILGRRGVQLAAGESIGKLAAPHEGRSLSSFYLELRRGGEIADPSKWFGDNER